MNLKSSISLLSCIALGSAWASADLPKKQPVGRYSGLWMNSPFTSKPPPVSAAEAINPLSDYALIGLAPIAGGYRVTLINKKTPDERIHFETDNPSSKYKVLGVTRKEGDPLGTVVRLSDGTNTGSVSYDEKLLTLAAAPAKAAPPQPGQQPNPNMPPGAQPQPNNGQLQRQPRPRVVPPPAPAAQGATQGAAQVAQPQRPQIQQGQPAQQNNMRPARRRN
jgi:hypothetical protein